jgi:hypothetical protein
MNFSFRKGILDVSWEDTGKQGSTVDTGGGQPLGGGRRDLEIFLGV